MPLVSVIIPTRNRSALLREAIESVLAVRRDGFELEVIVVDDGSTDDTATVVAAYPVRVLQGEGRGASNSRNVGMNAATGDYIAFLDDDDLWLPNNIAPQLRIFAEHPEYGVVHARLLTTDADRSPYGEPVPSLPLHSGWIFNEFLSYWPQLGTVVVRTAVVREVGVFDTTLISEEEWDWMLRIARRYPVGRVEDVVMLFRQRGYDDDVVAWKRMPDTIKVFHRHTAQLNLPRRLSAQRIIWKHRGWYASGFVQSARFHLRQGDRRRALRCLRYAAQTSPVHTVALLAKTRGAGGTA